MTEEEFIGQMSYRTGKYFTTEQQDFLKDFTTPQISFSLPGTGKTHSAVAGLAMAELFHGIPANKIFALSFTRLATAELKTRHEQFCRKLGVQPRIQFRTLHSICNNILKDNCALLDMPELAFGDSLSVAAMANFIMEKAEDLGISVRPYKLRSIVHAIRQLNASLIFDKAHVESKMAFQKTGLAYEEFTQLRSYLYRVNQLTEQAHLDDVMTYTLQLLLTQPQLSQQYRDNIRLILVDEFQDMSLLQLKVLSLLTDNLCVIGDINQQIYGFNGACHEIVQKYYEYYPTAKRKDLTQSFRCCNQIADYATRIIVPNNPEAASFKGNGTEGIVHVGNDLDVDQLVDKIQAEFVANRNVFKKSIMFLFRNNFSIVPLADALYRKRLPFRVSNYKPAHEMPVVKDICDIIELALHPELVSNLWILKKIVPEFAKYSNIQDIPLAKIMIQDGCSLFDTNYEFKNPGLGQAIMDMLMEVSAKESQGCLAFDLFAIVYPVYNEVWLKDHNFYLEQPPEYYTMLVSELIRNKTYFQFIKDERDKVAYIQDFIEEREGIRCYTFHAAKGTEADIVHIIDAEEGIIPATKKLKEMQEAGCIVDEAREVRNERCLCYVATTRAKEELNIWYNQQLSDLFTGTSKYQNLDAVYASREEHYRDVEEFRRFFGGDEN